MSKEKKPPTKHKVLDNYKKVGTKFIPPFHHNVGPIKSISYARQTLPELIWWDVIIDKASYQFAIDLASAIASHFRDRKQTNLCWGFISDYAQLNKDEFAELKKSLNSSRMLLRLQKAIEKFIEIYPNCPLAAFFDVPPSGYVDISYISRFEKRLSEAEDKRSRPGILIQGQVVYMGLILQKLRIQKDQPLADFPEIAKYPETEISKIVGATVCATVNFLAIQMLPDYSQDTWVQYFWGRNYEIRPIKMSHLSI